MKNGRVKQVWCRHRCQSEEALSRAASMFSEAVCCLITHCGSHLPQTSEFTRSGQGHIALASDLDLDAVGIHICTNTDKTV